MGKRCALKQQPYNRVRESTSAVKNIVFYIIYGLQGHGFKDNGKIESQVIIGAIEIWQ